MHGTIGHRIHLYHVLICYLLVQVVTSPFLVACFNVRRIYLGCNDGMRGWGFGGVQGTVYGQ